MANPYAAGASAGSIMANVKGDIGNNNDNPQGRLDETGLATAEVTRRLLAYTRPHRVSLIASFVASAVSVVLQLYVPIVIGRAIDCMVSAGDVDFAALVALLQELALVVVGAAVTQWLSGYCTNRLTYETVRDLRIDAFSRFRDLPLSFVDAHSHGDLLSRVVNDADQVGDGLLQGLTQLFTGVVSMLVAWLIARYSAKSFKEQQALQGSLGGYVEEMVGSQKLVCAFAYGDRAQAGFDEINQRLLGVGEHAQFTSSLSNPATRVVNNITYAVVAVVGCICVISGWPSVLTVGQVQTFLSYANQYMKPFNEISNVVTQIQTAYASARRLFTLIDAPAQSADPAEPEVDENPEGALEFSHVDFSYVPDRPLLQDISFAAKPGQTIALVGPTGCGKTTLINLLLRFYDVDSGQILVDGHDTSNMRREDLRSLFGMVLQDTWLFRGTVRENIAYGTPGATMDDVVAAAKQAHAHKFIEQLPQGYDTLLGEDGGSLSQGQRQLLCIARVMLADPTILLLDEATSSIDTRTELQVQDRLWWRTASPPCETRTASS